MNLLITRFAGMTAALPFIFLLGSVDTAKGQLRGNVRIDGSSTVAPIMTGAAELFMEEQPRVRVTVGISGTGGGFKKFLSDRANLRTDINNASRPIKESEVKLAAKLGIEYVEIPVGVDGIVVMVHPANDFCSGLTVKELRRIWEPGSDIKNWKQIRDGFPDLPLKLYGPDTDSGTFDYFTEAIVGRPRASRSDYTASASDNVLVQGIAGDRGSLGYFGYSYYHTNKKKLKLVGIDNGDGKMITPTLDVIREGNYQPLSRPLFIYVNKSSLDRKEVTTFFDFFFANAQSIVEHPRINYVSLPESLYDLAKQRLAKRVTGSAMGHAHGKRMSLTEIFLHH
ncbi:MAG: PstS family phosphate ABC transporter substrate-binding protein [Phycisphaerae bacterium]